MNSPHEHADIVTLINEEAQDNEEESDEDVAPSGAVSVSVIQTGEKRGRGRPRGSVKKLKGIPAKDPNAPKRPTTAYLLFCNQHRDRVRTDNPHLCLLDVTKELGHQWTQLDEGDRQYYITEAERDRERYVTEFQEYQRSESYQEFMKSKYPGIAKAQTYRAAAQEYRAAAITADSQSQVCTQCGQCVSVEDRATHACSKRTHVITSNYSDKDNRVPGTNISIFTPEFLAHTRELEVELRTLRRFNNDLEEENALLSKHNEHLKDKLQKLDMETRSQFSRNELLKDHLLMLKRTLTSAFEGVVLPDSNETPTLETIDSYMLRLQALVAQEAREHQPLIATVERIMKQVQSTLSLAASTTA